MKMSEMELRAITDGEMRQAVGYWSGKLAMQRQKAMVYYYGEAKLDLAPPEVVGRSSVVQPDVRNTIESMLPQLMVKFCGSDTVVEFEANKPGDEPKAEQATDYVNHIFFVKNPGERIAYNWMKDALLSKNGIIKVWWDTRAEETREEYKGLSDVELAQLDDDEEIEIIQQDSYPDEEDAEQRAEALQKLAEQMQQPAPNPAMGMQRNMQIQAQIDQINQMPPKMLFDVVCKRSRDGGRIRVENVPPEEFLISRQAKSIEEATFVGHRVMRTASQLVSMGYPESKVDALTSDDQATGLNMERIERLNYDDEQAFITQDTTMTLDKSQRIIWVTECYVRVDFDGDGIAELRKVVRAGNEILDNEIVDAAPFVSITPVPMPHKFFGLSVADLAMEGQKINTAILRGMLDNLYLQVNGRYFAVDGQVNLDDLLTSRPGGVVRMKQPGMAGRLDQGMGDASTGMNMLEYMKGYQEDSTGWTRYNQGADGDSLNQTATGVTQITNRADMRLDLIARNFAEGWRALFRMILKLCSQHQQKESVVKLRGEWVNVSPRDWRNGFEATVNVGLGTGNKDQLVGHLMALAQRQQLGLQIGTANPANIYETDKEIAKAMGFKSADKFFTDPRKSPPNPQPNPAQAAMQLERERMQMQAQVDQNRQEFEARQQQLKMQMEKELEQFKIQAQMERDRYKAELDRATALEIARMNNDAELVRAQIQAQSVITPAQDVAAESAVNVNA